jgi:hypothetical protein
MVVTVRRRGPAGPADCDAPAPARKLIGMQDLETLDATAQAQLVRRRELTVVELVEAAIERVERLNPRSTPSSPRCTSEPSTRPAASCPRLLGVGHVVRDRPRRPAAVIGAAVQVGLGQGGQGLHKRVGAAAVA